MNANQRRDEIVRFIFKNTSATIMELTDTFKVSTITIHRDLDILEEQGYIQKIRGGACVNSIGNFEKSYLYRSMQKVEEKKKIAAYASQFIKDGSTILLDNSTTVYYLLAYFQNVKNLTVFTYFQDVIEELTKPNYDCKLFCLGGEYSRAHNCFIGPIVDRQLSQIHVDTAFMCSAALDPSVGIMQHQIEESNRKRLIIQAADETTLLIDNSKLMKRALFSIAPLNSLTRMVTNKPVTQEVVSQIIGTGIELHLV
ncbi:MAG: DeoR/GlpR family DNA-binding transcription regulator [Anaerolineaceae bacterium]|jgi:DeoR/GlpR family transcriptional regulator of sugar metabolism